MDISKRRFIEFLNQRPSWGLLHLLMSGPSSYHETVIICLDLSFLEILKVGRQLITTLLGQR